MLANRLLQILIIIILIKFFSGISKAQPPLEPLTGRDDERIWCDLNIEGRLDPDPYAADFRGGNVTLHVTGLLEPAEYEDSSLIALINYGSWDLPFTLSIEPCKVINRDDGSVTTESSCRANPGGKIIIYLRFNLDTGLGDLILHSKDIATCTAGSDCYIPDIMYYIGSIEDRESQPDPPLTVSRAEFETEFEKHWSWDMQYVGMAAFTGCPLLWKVNLTISSKPPEETKLTLSGCADIMIGVTTEITATAEPGGGTYTWSCEPSDIFSISGSGSTASITGKSARRATVRVEYKPKKGKKIEKTMPGSVVELLSVNGGAEIPKIGLYDENGAKKASLQIPIVQDPPAGELLDFPPADPSIASLQNLGTSLVIQGVNEGTTTAQGKTICGQNDEHVLAIEVVPCDDETIKKLRDQLKDLQSQLDENKKRMNDKLKDPEFTRTMNEINRHLTTMGAKTLVIGTAVAGGIGGEAPGVADYVLEVLSQIRDVTEEGTWSGRWSVKDMAIKHYTNMGKRITLGIINDLIEYGEAYSEAQHGLEILDKIVKELEDIRREGDEIRKKYNEIDLRLMDVCKDYGIDKDKPKPPPAEPPPSEPPPTEPGPKPPTPPPTEPGGREPTEPAGGEEPPVEPGDNDIIVEPPPPPPPPPQGGPGGFPVDCGCDRWNQSGWGNSTEGLGRIRQDVGSVVPCLDDFMNNIAQPARALTDSTRQLFENMDQALLLPEAQRVETFRGYLPLLDDLKTKFTQLGGEFMSISDSLNQCGPAIEQAGEIIGAEGSQ